MFGYVMPCREKLTEEQWSEYRATYCGLCHTLGDRYGFLARFLLNYDFTFLALLLRREADAPCRSCRRCISAPIRGRSSCQRAGAMDAAADVTVLLVYWKLKDQLADEGVWGKLSAQVLLLLFARVFRRGRRQNARLNETIGLRLSELQQLEQVNSNSIDRTADRFAAIMTAMVPPDWEEASRRSLEQLLYHLGRWIYLIDAWDDLEDDRKRRRYNPIASRFALMEPDDDAAQAKAAMERTIMHSENLAISAFHLTDFGHGAPIVENVLCAGLPIVRNMVFTGQWKQGRKQKKQELNRL